MKRLPLFGAALFLLFCSGPLFGADFGAALGANPEWQGAGAEIDGVYSFGLDPWFSASPHEKLDLYFSAGLSLRYEDEEWTLLPELGRFMLAAQILPRLGLELGRIRFGDPNGLVATGLFDGLSLACELGGSRLSVGGYYTGFLYKGSADIYMTLSDTLEYQKPFDWENAVATYFASRRVLASLTWEAPALGGSPHGLYVNGLAQFDLNGKEDSLHSQYLSARFRLSPLTALSLSAGGVLSLVEQGEGAMETGLALVFNADWSLPTAIQDLASLGCSWGSGGDSFGLDLFRPLSSVGRGKILSLDLAGSMVVRVTYTLRPYETLSLALEGRYFFLDKGTDRGALGGELYGSAQWAPVSDLTLTAGGGAFFPGTGTILPSDAALQWLASAGLRVSF
jgi:hypothetical protein